MNISNHTPLTLTSDEELLLDFITKERIKILDPTISGREIKYEDLKDFVKKNGYDWELIHDLLLSLENKGFLKIKGDIRALICPECNSPHVLSKYSCVKCQSTKLSKVELIEHKICGYTATRDKFQGPSGMVCPNCGKQQTPVSRRSRRRNRKKEFEIIGSAFECEACGQRFERPDIVHFCQDCESKFNYKLGNYEKILIYEINMDAIKKLSNKEDINVLLVEDNPDDVEIITINLKRSSIPYIVDVAVTGNKALNAIEEKYYDVILLDYQLPDMTGLDLIQEIKKKDIKTPIIILTGIDEREIAVSTMKLGASDYLVKSAELYEILPNIIMKVIKN
jgi:CheY-like chemotaxis protein